MFDFELEWLNEKIERMPYNNWLYKIICFLMGKRKTKLTYKDLFLLLYGLNRKKYGDKEAKELSLYKIVEIYASNNNRMPKGIKI